VRREAIDDESQESVLENSSRPKQDHNPVEVTGKTLIKVKSTGGQINS
jgi:hypothetical protein